MAQAVTPERIAEARRYVANAEEHARHWRAEVQKRHSAKGMRMALEQCTEREGLAAKMREALARLLRQAAAEGMVL